MFSTVTDKPCLPTLFLVTQIIVLDPANRIVKLGAVLPGQVVKKTVSLVNNSLAPLTFNQSVMFSIPELQEAQVSAGKWGGFWEEGWWPWGMLQDSEEAV